MAVELKYNNPLTLETGTGITGSINGENFTTREIEGLIDENVTLNIGQEVETTSNTTFNDVTSSDTINVGNIFLGDGFISSSNSVVAHTGSVVVTGNTTATSMTTNGQLNYGSFEGVIPEGQYGAGLVEIWDEGKYTPEKWETNKIVFMISGKKLSGRYTLIKLKKSEKNEWLLFKTKS